MHHSDKFDAKVYVSLCMCAHLEKEALSEPASMVARPFLAVTRVDVRAVSGIPEKSSCAEGEITMHAPEFALKACVTACPHKSDRMRIPARVPHM